MDSKKRAALEKSLAEWYSEDEKRQATLDDIVNGRAGFSLRTIDWLVTNFAARNPVVYSLPSTGEIVDVNSMYKDVLRCFHKSGFDSFKRKGTSPSEAELRQKNFFRWAIENGVVDYVATNAKEIESDMARMRRRPRPRDRTPEVEEGDEEAKSRKKRKSHAMPPPTGGDGGGNRGDVVISSSFKQLKIPNFVWTA